MQQVGAVASGERDYGNIRGDTGPLVYGGGHVLAYSLLRLLTGGRVLPAQVCFAGVYLASQAVVLSVLVRCETVPPWALPLLCLSKRAHSVHVLRLFNDGIATALSNLAVGLLALRRFRGSLLVFSLVSPPRLTLARTPRRTPPPPPPPPAPAPARRAARRPPQAASVKMNVLLLAPGVAALCLQGATLGDVLAGGALGLLAQVLVAWPFLRRNPAAYLGRAFNLAHRFRHEWSVNFQFLPASFFGSPAHAGLLVALHLALLVPTTPHCASQYGR